MKQSYFVMRKRYFRRWRYYYLWPLVVLMAFLTSTYSSNAQNIQGIIPVQAPINGTTIDGDAYANHGTFNGSYTGINGYGSGDIFYWESIFGGEDGMGVFTIDEGPIDLTNPIYPLIPIDFSLPPYNVENYKLVLYRDSVGNKDPTIFDGSNKINDNPNSYVWGEGSVPNKNEIQNAGVIFTRGDHDLGIAVGVDTEDDDIWVSWAADRQVTNGSSYIDFEFLQATLTMDGYYEGALGGGFTSYAEPGYGGRTPGDILVTVEFTNGGPVANVMVYSWRDEDENGATDGIYEYGIIEDESVSGAAYVYPTGSIFATINTEETYVHFPAFGQTKDFDVYEDGSVVIPDMPYYKVNQWCEGAINLTALFGAGGNPCFTVSTVFTRTRTSGESSTSELADIPGPPAQLDIHVGTELFVDDASDLDCFQDASGSITVSATTTLDVLNPTFRYKLFKEDEFGEYQELTDRDTGDAYDAPSPYTFYDLEAGNYRVWVEDMEQCSTDTEDWTITEPPLLTVDISDITICEGDIAIFTASADGGTPSYGPYEWTVDGVPQAETGYQLTVTGAISTVPVTVKVYDDNSCDASDAAMLYVDPVPDLNDDDLTLCADMPGGTTATFDLETAVIGLTAGMMVDYDVPEGSDINNFEAVDGTTVTVTAYYEGSDESCTDQATITLHVDPVPDLNDDDLTLCADMSGGTTATFDLETAVIGLTAGMMVDYDVPEGSDINNFEAVDGTTVTVTAYYEGSDESCTDQATITLHVDPVPDLNDDDLTLCADMPGGTTATFDLETAVIGLTAGMMVDYDVPEGSDINNFEAVDGTTVIVTAYYEGSDESCTDQATITLHVDPVPDLNDDDLTLCADMPGGTTATFDLETAVIGLTAGMMVDYDVPEGSDINNFEAVDGATVTVTAYYEGSDESCTDQATITLHVDPVPDLNDDDLTLCADMPGGTTATFDLETAVIGLTAGMMVDYDVPEGSDINNFEAVDGTTVTVTAYYSESDESCTDQATITLHVAPIPDLNDDDLTLCADMPGGTTATFDLETAVIGLTAGMMVDYDVPEGSDINNFEAVDGTTVTVTAYYEGSDESCTDQATITLHVDPVPDLNDDDLTLCADMPGGTTATFDLETAVIGLTAGMMVDYDVPEGSDINNFEAVDGTTVTVTAYYEGSDESCTDQATITLHVDPVPDLNDDDLTLCADMPGGTTATFDLETAVIGLTAGMMVDYDVPEGSDINNFEAVDGATVTVTAYYSESDESCTDQATITLHVAPIPDLNDDDLTLCADMPGGTTATFDLETAVIGLTAGMMVDYDVPEGSDINNFEAVDGATVTVTAYYEGSDESCTDQATITLHVDPVPDLNDDDLTLCADMPGGTTATFDLETAVIGLTAGMMVDYDVPEGSDINNFEAVDGTTVTVTAYYSESDESCTDQATITLHVDPVPDLNDDDLTLCADMPGGTTATFDLETAVIGLTAGMMVDYDVPEGSDINNFEAVDGTTVTVTAYYEGSDESCTDQATITLHVDPVPDLNDDDLTLCADMPGGTTATFDLETAVIGLTAGMMVDYDVPEGSDINNFEAVDGTTVTVTAYYEGSDESCTDQATITLHVDPVPDLNDDDLTLCADMPGGTTATFDLETAVIGLTAGMMVDYDVPEGSDINNFEAVDGTTVTVTEYYSESDESCTDQATITLHVEPYPILVVNDPPADCYGTFVDLSSDAITFGSTLYDALLSYWYWDDVEEEYVEILYPDYTMIMASGTYYIKATTPYGCEDMQPVVVTFVVCDEFCTYTQGFYGSQKGTACDLEGEIRGDEFTAALISQGPLFIGSGTSTIIFDGGAPNTNEGIAAIIAEILPGGRKSYVLTNTEVINVTSAGDLSMYLTKQGRLDNQLFAQTLTLGLNLRINDNGLASVPLETGYLTTQDKLFCEEGSGGVEMICTPVLDEYGFIIDYKMDVNPYHYYKLPERVLCYMEENPKYEMTVGGLFYLANEALGGSDILDGDCYVSLDDIASAVDMINNAFDECRIFVGYLDEEMSCSPIELRSSVFGNSIDIISEASDIIAYPNPFSETVIFEFTSGTDSHATLDILNITGQKIVTLFNQDVQAGVPNTIEYAPGNIAGGVYFYKLILDDEIQTGKIIYQDE